MRITLNADDVSSIINKEGMELDFDLSVFKSLGIDAEIMKSLAEQTAHNAPLYREIRRQVDEYISQLIPTEVGNYVRTKNHTCQRLISESVREHIESGIKSGIKHFAQKKAKQIADALLMD